MAMRRFSTALARQVLPLISRNGQSVRAASSDAVPKAVPTVGIDLGTTNSCVAVMDGDSSRVLENEEGKRTTPSVVGFQEDGSRIVGHAAQRAAVMNPKTTIYAAKRLIGRRHDDAETKACAGMVPYDIVPAPNGDAWVKVGDDTYSPSQIGAFVLNKMAETAAKDLGDKPTRAVITVPAYFNDSQRQATKDAGRIAGFSDVRIVNEPTAAALAYGLNQDEEMSIAVYDLGGGTFDISILEVTDNVFEVKASNGDAALGGEDFDEALLDHMLKQFKAESGTDLSNDSMALQRLREAAEDVKRRLDNQDSAEVNLPFITQTDAGPVHFQLNMTKAQLEDLTTELIERTRGPCVQCVRDAQLSTSEIDRVLLVGGMTRMPKVVSTVQDIFDGIEPFKGVNPDEAVALGAAIQGGVLDGAMTGVALIDVTPLSLGTNVEGGLFARIIERNTPIPVKKTKTFTTAADNQTYIVAQILQGDREMAADNKLLGTLRLDGIPPMRRGVPQIDVEFDVNAEGLMKVTSTDLATGTKAETVVQTSGGLSESEIEQMIADAERYAEEDKERRAKVEVRNNAESLVHSTRTSVEDNNALLSSADKDAIESLCAGLESKLDSASSDELKKLSDELQNSVQSVFEQAYQSKAPKQEPPQQQGGQDGEQQQ